MQISGICDSGHKMYFNGFSNFSVEWNCCFYCRSSTHHLFSINLSPEEDPPICRYFGVKQVIWPIFSPFQAILRIFFFISNFMLTLPTSSWRGARYTLLFWTNHFLISLTLGWVVSYMCFINNSFMLRFISKLVVGSAQWAKIANFGSSRHPWYFRVSVGICMSMC